jgi:hypothetical protein
MKKTHILLLLMLISIQSYSQLQFVGYQDQSLRAKVSQVSDVSFTVSKLPVNGKVNIDSKGNLRYDPKLNFKGTDNIELTMASGKLIINFDIKTTNHKPDYITPVYNNYYYRATSNFFRVKKNTISNFSIFGVQDVDGDVINYSVMSSPTKGVLQLNANGSFSYMPNQEAEGWDSFKFKMSDGKGGVNTKLATIFIYPGKEEILSKLDASTTSKIHPHVLFNEDKLQFAQSRTPAWINTSVNKLVDNAKSNALFTAPIRDYSKGATRTTAEGEWLKTLSIASALANNQTDIDAIFTKALAELMAVCNAPNWGTTNSLDVPAMAYQVGMAYSLMYDKLTEAQRLFVKQTLVQKGLNILLTDFKTADIWHAESTNWNMINNSSALLAAFAIWNEPTDAKYNYRDIAGQILEFYFKSIPLAYTRLNPGGGWFEGIGYYYWMMRLEGYGNSTLMNTIGTDFGLRNCEGFKNSGYYVLHQNGPKGQFNIADDGDPSSGLAYVPEIVLQPAQLNNQTDLGNYFYSTNWRFSEMTLANYNAEFQTNSTNLSQSVNPQDYYVEGAELFYARNNMFNSSKTGMDLNSCFVGFKAGQNTDWHAALDIGNFVFDAFGERWIRDIGGDNYSISGYGAKQTTYRKRAEGQNTLVINPGTAIDQSFAWEKIIRNESSGQKSFAVAEMSSTYKYHVYALQRGIMLDKAAQTLLVQDEIHTRGAADVYSFMHTKAAISIDASGRKAIFTQGSKKMVAYLLSPADVKFTVMNAEALTQSKPIMASGQNANTGYRKLVVNIKDSSDIRLAVWLVPFNSSTDTEPTVMPTLKPLSEWTLDDSKTPVQLIANVANSTVNLSWSQVSNATGYNLYKSLTGVDGTYMLVNSEPITSSTFSDNDGIEGQQFYKVSAIVGAKEFGTTLPTKAIVTTGVSEIKTLPKFDIFPNPTKDIVNLNFNDDGRHIVRIYDTAMNLIFNKTIYSKVQQINTSSFSKGIYLIEVVSQSGQRSIQKLVVL